MAFKCKACILEYGCSSYSIQVLIQLLLNLYFFWKEFWDHNFPYRERTKRLRNISQQHVALRLAEDGLPHINKLPNHVRRRQQDLFRPAQWSGKASLMPTPKQGINAPHLTRYSVGTNQPSYCTGVSAKGDFQERKEAGRYFLSFNEHVNDPNQNEETHNPRRSLILYKVYCPEIINVAISFCSGFNQLSNLL